MTNEKIEVGDKESDRIMKVVKDGKTLEFVIKVDGLEMSGKGDMTILKNSDAGKVFGQFFAQMTMESMKNIMGVY